MQNNKKIKKPKKTKKPSKQTIYLVACPDNNFDDPIIFKSKAELEEQTNLEYGSLEEGDLIYEIQITTPKYRVKTTHTHLELLK